MKVNLFMYGLLLALFTVVTACGSDDEVQSLANSSWKLSVYVDADNNTVKEPVEPQDNNGNRYTVCFLGDGSFHGYSCGNEIGGLYRISGDSIIWMSVAITKVWLGEPYDEADSYFFHSLTGSSRFQLNNNQLRLYYNNRKDYMLFDKWSSSK